LNQSLWKRRPKDQRARTREIDFTERRKKCERNEYNPSFILTRRKSSITGATLVYKITRLARFFLVITIPVAAQAQGRFNLFGGYSYTNFNYTSTLPPSPNPVPLMRSVNGWNASLYLDAKNDIPLDRIRRPNRPYELSIDAGYLDALRNADDSHHQKRADRSRDFLR
jgi:hypothetical protein